VSGFRLVARAPALGLRLELEPGEAVRLDGGLDRPDRDGTPGAAGAERVATPAEGAPAEGAPAEGAPAAGATAAVDWFRGSVPRRRGDRLVVDGRPVTRRGTAARARAGLVIVTETAVAPTVSVRDHLAAVTTRERADAVLAEVPRLAGRGGDPAGVLSGGERRLLAWARAALLTPKVVVLDGAATGLDADATSWATERVARWRREQGVVVLVVPRRAEEVRWVRTTSS
jgi:ABC-type branched-subunit amino acid transport system ATPase component